MISSWQRSQNQESKPDGFPGVRVIAFTPAALPGGGNFPVEFMICSTAEPRELLEIAKKAKKALALETKHPVPSGNEIENRILELVKPYKDLDIALLSFSWLAIEKVVRFETGIETVALVNALNAPVMNRFSSAKSFAPSIEEIRDHPELVAKYQSEGKRVFVWTVNEVNDLKLCAQLGVDVVITDMPARAVSELGYP